MNEEWVFVGAFASKVIKYVKMEWELDIFQFPVENQDWAIQLILDLKDKDNLPNIAAKIAMGLPL